jgi:hypothetical protein
MSTSLRAELAEADCKQNAYQKLLPRYLFVNRGLSLYAKTPFL